MEEKFLLREKLTIIQVVADVIFESPLESGISW